MNLSLHLGLLTLLYAGQDSDEAGHAEAEDRNEKHGHDAGQTYLDVVEQQHGHVQDVQRGLQRSFATEEDKRCKNRS